MEVNITLKISCAFISEQHRDTIVETARIAAGDVLTNMLMLIPNGSRVRPMVIMGVQESGEEEVEYDIAKEIHAKAMAEPFEDPFA